MEIARPLCCLLLIAASCETFQYIAPQNIIDSGTQDTHNTTADSALRENQFTIQSLTYVTDYFGNSNSCLIDISTVGKFEFPSKCQVNSFRTGFTMEDSCVSLFRLKLSNEKNDNLPDTSQGNWKLSISGSHKTRNFFRRQGNDTFAYWVDAMEIYLVQGANRYYLGVVQGDDWLQADPVKATNFLFENSIPMNIKFDAVDLRFFRRCASKNFAFNNIDASPPAISNSLLSKFIIENIEFAQVK